MPRCNALFLSNLSEYHHELYIAENQILGNTYVVDSTKLSSTILTKLAPKPPNFLKLRKITAITPIKAIQGHNFRYQWKARMRLLLHPVSHHFQDIADYWSNFRHRQGVPLFIAFFLETPIAFCGMVQKCISVSRSLYIEGKVRYGKR